MAARSWSNMQLGGEVVSNRPRVLLADDHALIRERVAQLLAPKFDIVGTVENGRDMVSAAQRLSPEVVILDVTMPGLSGIDAARQLRRSGSAAKIVFLTVHEQVQFVRRCMAEGAMAYVTKSRLESDLIHAIEEALLNRHYISPPLFR